MVLLKCSNKFASGDQRQARYLSLKRFALLSAYFWMSSLLALAIAELFPTSLGIALSITIFTLILVTALVFLDRRRERSLWYATENQTDCERLDSCSQITCNSGSNIASGGCALKFRDHLQTQIFEMELDRLRLMLRRKFGYDIVFFLGWIVFCSFRLANHTNSTSVRLALSIVLVSSLLVIVARVTISQIAFAKISLGDQ